MSVPRNRAPAYDSRHAIWEAAFRWSATGFRAALARVVDSSSSRPRALGTSMVVSETGHVVGSISGGCVDGEICAGAQQVIDSGRPALRRFGEGDLMAPGLPCGGTLDVFVEPVDRSLRGVLAPLLASLRNGIPVALVTALTAGDAGEVRHSLVPVPLGSGSVAMTGGTADRVRALSARGATGLVSHDPSGDHSPEGAPVFVQSFPAPPRMLVFGADDFAAALTRIGRFLGYRVTLCDARPAFATAERFPDADEVVVRWPHDYVNTTPVGGSTAICVLTHDAKFDVPLLAAALRTEAGYVGAMGSRRTHADRVRRLREAGVTEAELRRLAAPIGLDLGADTPEEVAVSIAAEIVAQHRHGSGARLRDLDLPIHRGPGNTAATPG